MTVAERMRRDGWYCPMVVSWRHSNLFGMRARVTVDGTSASVGGYGRIVTVYDGAPIGLRSLAQRAKSAARREARKGRKP